MGAMKPLLACALSYAAVAGVCVLERPGAIELDLIGKARAAGTALVRELDVTADGVVLSLRGQAPSTATRAALVRRIQAIDGVEAVEARGMTIPGFRPLALGNLPTETPRVPLVRLSVTTDADGRLVFEGVAPGGDAVERWLAAASLLTDGKAPVNTMRVGETEAPDLAAALLGAMSFMKELEKPRIDATTRALRMSGITGDPELRPRIRAALLMLAPERFGLSLAIAVVDRGSRLERERP